MCCCVNITPKVWTLVRLPNTVAQVLTRFFHPSVGLRVFATARWPEVLVKLAALGIITLALDVTNLKSINAARDYVSSITGGILDCLVNNAVGRTSADLLVLRHVWTLIATNSR